MADISVELLDHMGSDLSVVNAARVSFDKVSEWETVDLGPCTSCDEPCWLPDPLCRETARRLSDRDTKLIHYLAKHNHWSPFSHAFVSFRVSAPVFVARQLQKHTVGLAWNEVSRRYVDAEPTFYVPQTWRKRAENVKQGSSDEAVFHLPDFHQWSRATDLKADELAELCLEYYQHLLYWGVCPEQARMVLPQSMMTTWIWSGSLMAFARVCNLRLDSHTQKETQTVAQELAVHCAALFPVSFNALTTKDTN